MKHFKEIMNREVSGMVAVSTVLTVVGATAVAIYTAMTYVNAAIQPIQAQAQNTAIIAAQTQTDVAWIKQALEQNNIRPK